MPFSTRKSTPSTSTHFNEADDVRHDAMVKALFPPKKGFPMGSRTPSGRVSKAAPYPTPPSTHTAGRLFPNTIIKKDARRPTLASGLDPSSRSASSEGPDPNIPPKDFDSAVAKVHGADSERKKCSGRKCRNELPMYTRWKTCDRCRQRARDQQRRHKVNKDAKIREVLGRQRHSSPFKNEEELEIPPDWSHLSTEERFQNYMSQLRALGKLKARQSHALEADASEHRTSRDLYDALASVLVSAQPSRHSYKTPTILKPVNFRGHYHVVRDHASPLSRERILAEVQLAEDGTFLHLRKDVQPVVSRFRTQRDQVGYTAEYQCGCRADGKSCGGTVMVKIKKVQEGVVHGEKVTFRILHP
ncbi:hypothetical protein PHLGIDRAFT_267407 [Phlebiopsis gigantea 11061_1 CR5-6]|uniref:Uncharacterized protein n=1 Tax=Phlebiopsis gigantea (strain 11061_1 CR5-6) TaxID=745531 RepID=A0A0C3PSC3_PHLG1|nr:hypothetical protein PHLGIDRAFT_267407 [Phlebiopsis gigantea 11061_1 CR5-6]